MKSKQMLCRNPIQSLVSYIHGGSGVFNIAISTVKFKTCDISGNTDIYMWLEDNNM